MDHTCSSTHYPSLIPHHPVPQSPMGFLRQSLCSPGCLGTHCVDQASFKLTEIHLPLPRAWIKGMLHAPQPLANPLLLVPSFNLEVGLRLGWASEIKERVSTQNIFHANSLFFCFLFLFLSMIEEDTQLLTPGQLS